VEKVKWEERKKIWISSLLLLVVCVCPRLPLFSSKKTFTTDDDGSGKGLAQGTSQEEE
jgi:hypothetical protein